MVEFIHVALFGKCVREEVRLCRIFRVSQSGSDIQRFLMLNLAEGFRM